MRVLRQCFTPTHSIYLIYDESKPFDSESHSIKNYKHLKKDFLDFYIKNLKSMYGKSWGFVHLCYFTVKNTGEISFEFDSDANYSAKELRLILRKAGTVKRRLMKEWDAKCA